MPAKKLAKKPVRKPAKKAAAKMPTPRVEVLAEDKLTAVQRTLLDSIRSGPRGGSISIRGPFAVFLHAPEFGQLAQKLGRLSFATRRGCRRDSRSSRFSGHGAGSGARSTSGSRTSRRPSAPASRRRRSATCTRDACRSPPPRTSARSTTSFRSSTRRGASAIRPTRLVVDVLGEPATVELVGILGYYVMISMILNVFRMLPPEGSAASVRGEMAARHAKRRSRMGR